MTQQLTDKRLPAMVIQVVTTRDLGGAQLTALAATSHARRRGHDVRLYAGPVDESGGAFEAAAVLSGIEVALVPPLRRKVALLFDVRALIWLTKEFRRLRPSVVHTHSSKAGVLGRVAARLAGVEMIVHTVHGWSFNEMQPPVVRWLYVRIERLLARFTNRLIVVCETDRTIGRSKGIGVDSQYRLVRSGVDVESVAGGAAARARARDALGLAESEFVVGAVTRLAEQKDPLAMIEGFAAFSARHPGAKLVVIGDGPLRAQVEAAIAARNIADRVQLVGARNDTLQLYAAFDVFVLTSRHEGLPRTLIEAMAALVPVIAAPVGGVAEVIEDGVNGLLLKSTSPDELADRLVAIAEGRDEARRMSERAQRACREFDAHAMTDQLLDVWSPADGMQRREPVPS